jgi:hypothetical protein
MSTAKPWNGKFLQVYPSLTPFETEEEWRAYWSHEFQKSIRFEVQMNLPQSMPTVIVAARSESSPPLPPLPPSPPTITSSQPSTKGWSYRKELTYTAPPGKYYIGDLCYALYDNVYDKVFGGRGYDSGFYSKGTSFFMVAGTAYGDGDYKGTDGYHYLVDAGIIGICSSDLIDPKNPSWKSGGKVHTFTEPVEVRFKNGIFHFSSGYKLLTINTQGEYDDDEY